MLNIPGRGVWEDVPDQFGLVRPKSFEFLPDLKLAVVFSPGLQNDERGDPSEDPWFLACFKKRLGYPQKATCFLSAVDPPGPKKPPFLPARQLIVVVVHWKASMEVEEETSKIALLLGVVGRAATRQQILRCPFVSRQVRAGAGRGEEWAGAGRGVMSPSRDLVVEKKNARKPAAPLCEDVNVYL